MASQFAPPRLPQFAPPRLPQIAQPLHLILHRLGLGQVPARGVLGVGARLGAIERGRMRLGPRGRRRGGGARRPRPGKIE